MTLPASEFDDNLNFEDKEGNNPLELAKKGNHKKIVKKLESIPTKYVSDNTLKFFENLDKCIEKCNIL